MSDNRNRNRNRNRHRKGGQRRQHRPGPRLRDITNEGYEFQERYAMYEVTYWGRAPQKRGDERRAPLKSLGTKTIICAPGDPGMWGQAFKHSEGRQIEAVKLTFRRIGKGNQVSGDVVPSTGDSYISP